MLTYLISRDGHLGTQDGRHKFIQSRVAKLFADDTVAYLDISRLADAQQLQAELYVPQQRRLGWNMEFNPGKCQVLHIPRLRISIIIRQVIPLEVTSFTKYLGVDISNDICWKTHINRITSNANKSRAFLRRNLKAQNAALREKAYKAIVHPQLVYAAPAWDPHVQEDILKIEMAQRRVARWVFGYFSLYSCMSGMLDKLASESLSCIALNQDWSSFTGLFEPHRDKTNKMACVPSEDSDQPGHPPSLIRVFAVRMKKAWVLSYPLSAQRRLIRLGGCLG